VSEDRLALALADMDNLPPVGSLWRHYKGGLVEVAGHALDSETLAPRVIYRHEWQALLWTHTLTDWHARVTLDLGLDTPRFVRVREDDP
jgi:hypothetical protein